MSFIIQEQAAGVIADDFDVSNYSVALPITVTTALTTVSTTVNLTTTSEMLLISTNNGTVAVVFDSATNAFGNAVLVRASVNNAAVNAVKISSTQVFVASLVGSTTALETVVLSVSGTTITVNSALATTLSATASFLTATKSLIQVGSSFVLCVSRAAGPLLIAFTVSGTTITAGSEVLRANSATTVYLVPYSSTVFMVIDYPTSSLTTNFAPYSVSGTTITAGTATTDTVRVNSAIGTSTNGNLLATGPNTSVTTTMRGVVVTITGTVATVSAVDMVTGITSAVVSISAMMFGNQMMVTAGSSLNPTPVLTGLTDVAGVATAAVNYFVGNDIRVIGFDQLGNVFINNSNYSYLVARFVGNDVVATPVGYMKPQNSSSTIPIIVLGFGSQFGTYESRSGNIFRTAEGKVSGTATTYAFAYSCKVNEIPEIQQAFYALGNLPSTLSEALQWSSYRTGSTLLIQKVVLT